MCPPLQSFQHLASVLPSITRLCTQPGAALAAAPPLPYLALVANKTDLVRMTPGGRPGLGLGGQLGGGAGHGRGQATAGPGPGLGEEYGGVSETVSLEQHTQLAAMYRMFRCVLLPLYPWSSTPSWRPCTACSGACYCSYMSPS